MFISSCKQRIRCIISCAMIYAGAAFAPKNTVIGVVGFLPALISKYLWITYKAFNCWRLYSWSLLIWISNIEFSLIEIFCLSRNTFFNSIFLVSFISSILFNTSSLSLYSKSFSNCVASFLYPSPISDVISSVSCGLLWSSHLLKVIPLVLLLNFSG